MVSVGELTAGALKVALMLSVLVFVAYVPFLFVDFSKGDGLLRDVDALQDMRRAMVDAEGVLDNWRGKDPCAWTGVVCGTVEEEKGQIRVVGLALEGAGLGGALSPAVARLSELRFFLGAGNTLSGSLAELEGCKRLERLELPSNLISGPVPEGLLLGMPRLKHLLLPHNNLVGGLSPGLFGKGCGELTTLVLAGNYLSGAVPAELGGCKRLEKVDLRGNSLGGAIPGAAFPITLRHLDLANNRLEGSVPPALAGLGELSFLDLSFNRLTGEVPRPLLDNRNLVLDVSGNSITTTNGKGFDAASAASDLKELKDREASAAAAGWRTWVAERVKKWSSSGRYAAWSQQASLRRSMLGEGGAPAAAPAPGPNSFDPQQQGQVGGGGEADGSGTGGEAEVKKRPTSTRAKVKRWALGLALGLVAGGLAAVVLATVLRMLLFLRRKPELVQGPIIFSKQITPKMLAALDQPTAFQEAESLGQGGSGRVYKSVLQPGDMAVAVKVVAVQRSNNEEEEEEGDLGKGNNNGKDHKRSPTRNALRPKQSSERRQIQSELQTLGAIRHRNLVALLAYVARPDDHLLVYEFMENGSLHSALALSAAGELVLDWPCRLRVAEGMATGLAYLHIECRPKVVHRDIKPGNILLDQTFDAHIGDFGLAKVLEDGHSHASTALLAGTLGYMAPEYHQTTKFTTQSDIYSLGVSMAALFCGKEPTDAFFEREYPAGLPAWLAELARANRLEEAVDSRLRDGDRLTEEQEKEVVLGLRLVLLCISREPSQRPNAADVLKMLQQISSHEDATRRRGLAELIAPDHVYRITNFGSAVVPRDSSGSSGSTPNGTK